MTFEAWLENKGFELDDSATKQAIYMDEMMLLAIGCDPNMITITSFDDNCTVTTYDIPKSPLD